MLGGLNSDIGLSFRGAGQREIQNSLSLDGINSSANLLAATSMRPIADAVEEIQVQTGSTSAEYGSYLGVHINVVTKSGTNTPHGSLFEFFQDDALDERGYFENRAIPEESATAQPVRRSQMDGPVVFPELYRRPQQDLLHGGVRRRPRRDAVSPIATVPTALMRQGNFSEISGTRSGIPSRASRIPATSSRRASCRRSRAELLEFYPAPNRPGLASNLQGRRVPTRKTSTSSSLASIRTSATRCGSRSATTGTTASTATS